ncbi:alcohol dehydrogenase, partial [Lachnellula arida]
PNELLLHLNTTGIYYSEIHYMLSDLSLPLMRAHGVRSPGHEGAGVVVALGANVTNWKVGNRAGVKPTWDTCGKCELCWGDMECHCKGAIPTGLKVPGRERISSILLVLRGIPRLFRMLWTTSLRVLLCAVARPCTVRSTYPRYNPATSQSLQVPEAESDTWESNLRTQWVFALTNGMGAHGVFVTAGSSKAYADALKMCGVGGKVMCVGMPSAGTAFVGREPVEMILKGLSVVGTLTGSLRDTSSTLEFAARGLLKPIVEKCGLENLSQAVEKLRAGKVGGRIVVDFNA